MLLFLSILSIFMCSVDSLFDKSTLAWKIRINSYPYPRASQHQSKASSHAIAHPLARFYDLLDSCVRHSFVHRFGIHSCIACFSLQDKIFCKSPLLNVRENLFHRLFRLLIYHTRTAYHIAVFCGV